MLTSRKISEKLATFCCIIQRNGPTFRNISDVPFQKIEANTKTKSGLQENDFNTPDILGEFIYSEQEHKQEQNFSKTLPTILRD